MDSMEKAKKQIPVESNQTQILLIAGALIILTLGVVLFLKSHFDKKTPSSQLLLKTTGMGCEGCPKKFQDRISTLSGIKAYRIHDADGTVEFVYNPEIITILQIKESLDKDGFIAKSEKKKGKLEIIDYNIQFNLK
ncbi:MAG: copper chaperone CopZ [Candidatus Marinamargulisbacteria bacterium]|jgi:copper chaperone CopZ